MDFAKFRHLCKVTNQEAPGMDRVTRLANTVRKVTWKFQARNIYIYRSYRSYIHQFYFILFHDISMYLYIFMIVYVHIVLTLSGSTR